ncbi:MAG: hypothetical protein ABUK01_16005 [Leptospirales bacterium]
MSFGEMIQKFCPGESPVLSVDCSPDSRLLAIGQIFGNDGSPTLSLWNLESGTLDFSIEESQDSENSVYKVIFNKNGNNLIYVLQYGEDFLLILYLLDKREKFIIKKAQYIEELLGHNFNLANELLIIPAAENGLEFWSLEPPKMVENVKIQEKLIPIYSDAFIAPCFSPDGKYLALGGMKEGAIFIYDTENYKLIQELNASFSFPGQILFDNHSRLVIAIDFWQKGVFVWDVKSGERYLEDDFDEHVLKVSCSAISPNNKYLAFGYNTGRIVLFDIGNGERLFSDKLHDARTYNICFTPDGNNLISAGEDWQIIVRSMV